MQSLFPILADNPACNPACNACHYKALDYASQLVRKKAWALKQLRSWESALREIKAAPEDERMGYRSKSWMRSRFEAGELSFGMYRGVQLDEGWGKEFVSWDSCPLHDASLQQAIGNLKRVLARALPRFVAESLSGVWIGSPHVVIVSKDTMPAELERIDWTDVLVPPLDRIWFHQTSQVGKKVFGHGEIRRLWGPSAEELEPIRAFRQVAGSLLKEARTLAVAHLLKSRPRMVLDLFCGTGDLSLLLPPEIGWIGIELAQEAARFAAGLREPRIATHEAFIGTVEHRLRDRKVSTRITRPFSLYLNPPRPGLNPEGQETLLALLRENPPETIAYLSCSASSLARDLKVIEAEGFAIELLQPYDFFPQTEHFETLALLTRSASTRPGPAPSR